MQKRFFEKQIVIKNFKCLGEFFPSHGFLPYVKQTKKLRKPKRYAMTKNLQMLFSTQPKGLRRYGNNNAKCQRKESEI